MAAFEEVPSTPLLPLERIFGFRMVETGGVHAATLSWGLKRIKLIGFM